MSKSSQERPVLWAGSSKRDLMAMPDDVQDDFGFGDASVIELSYDRKGDAFRAVYTVKFEEVLIVLHAFQKKSKQKGETPKRDMDLIHSRLKIAEEMYKEWKLKGRKNG
jgi:phage-related protein